MNYDDAKSIAKAYLDKTIHSLSPTEVAIIDESTLDTGHSWVFFYQHVKAVDGDNSFQLAGNLPVEVGKSDGIARRLPMQRAIQLPKQSKSGG